MKTRLGCFAVPATSCLLILSACGGGGSSGSSGPISNMMPPAAPVTADDVRVANADAIQDAALGASISVPTFGSVMQSTGAAKTGISSSFDGQRLAVSIGRQGASDIVLDTDNTIPDTDSGTDTSIVGLAGRSSRTRTVLSYTATSATLGVAAVDWANGDPADYLAGGYWVHADGDVAAGVVNNIEAGAFVDGPELSLSSPPNLPVQGTASYSGTAAGLYAVQHGADGYGPAGSAEAGEFGAIADLTADFSANTIGGCVGCRGGILIDGDLLTDYRVNLGTAPIDSNVGTFTSQSVTLSSATVPISQSSGAWGGRFSNIPDAAGDPRLVAGTFGGQAATPGGSQAVFLGAFGAGKQ